MKISCPSCRAAFALDDKRVPPAGLSIKCPKCKTPFVVHKPQPGEEGKIEMDIGENLHLRAESAPKASFFSRRRRALVP